MKCKWAAKKRSKQVNKTSELHVKTGWRWFHDPVLLCGLFQGAVPCALQGELWGLMAA